MKLLICGGRHYSDTKCVRRELEAIRCDYQVDYPDLTIIEGGASGADRIARRWALDHEDCGVSLIEVPAEWTDLSYPDAIIKERLDGTKYDAMAGMRRNRKMLEHKPDLVLAFKGGSGTRMMVTLAEYAGVPVKRIGWQ